MRFALHTRKIDFRLFLIVCLACYQFSVGQDTTQKISISQVLIDISRQENISFNYESSLLKDLKIDPLPTGLDLKLKLEYLEKRVNLVFTKISDAIITVSRPVKVCGYLKDSEFQKPLYGATIISEYANAVTDEIGYFEIELRSKDSDLTIRHIGFTTLLIQPNFFNLNTCQSILMVEQKEEMAAILIETFLVRGIDKRQDWTTSIDYEQFSLLPGLIESDVLQTIKALPSAMSVDETVSNVNIRGGSHDQNLIMWDDIKMYQTGHFFGLISSFNPLITQKAQIINNGSDVSLTDGVSGTIHMKTEQNINSEFENIVGLNFLNAELFSNIPIGSKSSLQVAGRKSIDEIVNTPTYNVYYDRVTQETEVSENEGEVSNSNQAFNFYDASLRWLYQISDKDVIRANFILISNELSFDEIAMVSGETQSRRSSISQNSIGYGLNYSRKWTSNLTSTLNISNSDYGLEALNANILENQRFLQENKVSETRINFQNTLILDLWKLTLGYDFTETEVINLNDIDVPLFIRRDEEVLREHAAFAQAWYTNNKKDFSVRAGVRSNYLTKFEKYIIEPRVSIRKKLGRFFEIEVQGEFKHQSTSQIINFQNDFLGIEKRRWQLTDDDTIPILESQQASIGLTYRNKGWLFDVKGYYKNVNGITTQSQSFNTKYEFARENGNYDAIGAEILLRKKFKFLNTWLSYAFIDNTYNFETLEDQIFPSNFDITHSVTLGSTFSNKRCNISTGINYRTGNPTSAPVVNNEMANGNINFGVANSNRLEDYLRIDASAVFKLKVGENLRSEIGASIWNISNRENIINDYYRIDDDQVNRFSRVALGLTTNAVVRFYF